MTVRIRFVWQYSMWVIEVSIKPPCAQIFGEHACHPERISRSPERSEGEGSSSPDTEILRGVYPERSEWAQDDSLSPFASLRVNSAKDLCVRRARRSEEHTS